MRLFVIRMLLVAAVVSAPPAVRAAHEETDRSVGIHPAATRATGRQVTILGSGDILVHPPTWQQARADAVRAGRPGYDFDPVFALIRPAVESADLAICHLEAPMGPGAPADFPRFRAPTDLGPAIRTAGYDTCSTASNHSLDQGEQGVHANLDALDAAGLRHTGTFRSSAEQATPTIYQVKGVKIGHLSWAMSFNGHTPPPDKPWLANRIDVPAVKRAAAAARRAGAQIVVLSAHWGTEMEHVPDANQLRWADELIADPDIDLIIGHHAHVVQPFEKINGKWIAYGVGNTLARHDFPKDANREGVLARFTFTEQPDRRWTVTRAEAVPIWLSLKPTIRVLDLTRLPPADRGKETYRAAVDRISDHLDGRGGVNDGLAIVRSR